MKYQITVIDDQPDSPLNKTDDLTPVLIRRRTDVDWEVLTPVPSWQTFPAGSEPPPTE